MVANGNENATVDGKENMLRCIGLCDGPKRILQHHNNTLQYVNILGLKYTLKYTSLYTKYLKILKYIMKYILTESIFKYQID